MRTTTRLIAQEERTTMGAIEHCISSGKTGRPRIGPMITDVIMGPLFFDLLRQRCPRRWAGRARLWRMRVGPTKSVGGERGLASGGDALMNGDPYGGSSDPLGCPGNRS
ncbi:hypothetical protein DMB42_07680 [Nonomuraea sp. WAC 01424]|nr:hypothetical protein DMB42_07680 [Nonomuraea sp. WAC 01424]